MDHSEQCISDDAVAAYHCRLNHPDVLPGRLYRRNHKHYALVCFVNTIIGLYLSRQLDLIPRFLAQATNHMQQHDLGTEHKEYASMVSDYLRRMARFILAQTTVEAELKARIPANLLGDDPK